MQKIVKPYIMKQISSINKIDRDTDDLFKESQYIFSGGITKTPLNRFLNDGIITEEEVLLLYPAAQEYFKESLKYIKKSI